MDHRVKNLFALANGVVTLSARSAGSAQELAASVGERLAALAQAHALTLPKVSGGNGRPMTLFGLIDTIIAPFAGTTEAGEARVAVRGPDVRIAGGSVTSLALLLHEFATNAAKYGALSSPNGSVDIESAEDGRLLVLTWTERGGPRLGRTGHEGFGTALGRATVERQLAGEIQRDFRPDGLVIRLSVDQERLIG